MNAAHPLIAALVAATATATEIPNFNSKPHVVMVRPLASIAHFWPNSSVFFVLRVLHEAVPRGPTHRRRYMMAGIATMKAPHQQAPPWCCRPSLLGSNPFDAPSAAPTMQHVKPGGAHAPGPPGARGAAAHP